MSYPETAEIMTRVRWIWANSNKQAILRCLILDSLKYVYTQLEKVPGSHGIRLEIENWIDKLTKYRDGQQTLEQDITRLKTDAIRWIWTDLPSLFEAQKRRTILKAPGAVLLQTVTLMKKKLNLILARNDERCDIYAVAY